MLQLTLRRNDAPSYRTATIDFPAREDLLAAELERIGIGIGSEKNCLVDKIDGDGRALFHLVGNCVNADEVQYLAKRMDSFGKDELAIFRSAVMAEDFPEVKDLINLTFNLHCYTVITDFSDVGSIGYAYLMSKEGCLPCNGQTNMHFVAAGRDLIASGGGVVTPFGVLYHNGNQPEMVYNGKQFPEYLYKDCVATVTLSPNEGGSPAETLYFPCFDVEIKKALLRLGADDPAACVARLSRENTEGFGEAVRNIFLEDFTLSEHLGTFNALTRCYLGFDSQAIKNFQAIVDYAWPQTPEEVLYLAENYYEFTAFPGIDSAEAYGRHMILDSGHFDCGPELEEYVDFRRYGENRIAQESGVFTAFGYLAYHGTSPAVEEILSRTSSPEMTME